jgi:hypothetical protein
LPHSGSPTNMSLVAGLGARRQRQGHNQALGAREGFSVRSGSFSPGTSWFCRRRRASLFCLSSCRRFKMCSRRP